MASRRQDAGAGSVVQSPRSLRHSHRRFRGVRAWWADDHQLGPEHLRSTAFECRLRHAPHLRPRIDSRRPGRVAVEPSGFHARSAVVGRSHRRIPFGGAHADPRWTALSKAQLLHREVALPAGGGNGRFDRAPALRLRPALQMDEGQRRQHDRCDQSRQRPVGHQSRRPSTRRSATAL